VEELESELARKDRALAETAALLVLKKCPAIWGYEDDATTPKIGRRCSASSTRLWPLGRGAPRLVGWWGSASGHWSDGRPGRGRTSATVYTSRPITPSRRPSARPCWPPSTVSRTPTSRPTRSSPAWPTPGTISPWSRRLTACSGRPSSWPTGGGPRRRNGGHRRRTRPLGRIRSSLGGHPNPATSGHLKTGHHRRAEA
jgi:hypothetical protein